MSRLSRLLPCLTAFLMLVALAGCPAPPPTDDNDPLTRTGTIPFGKGIDPGETTGTGAGKGPSDTGGAAAGPGTYFFCFWNVENLFDDKDDGRTTRGDKEPDNWFATDEAARTLKLKNLADVILPMNGGKGPDILAVAELESARSAELLQQTLNARLSDPALHYKNVLFEAPTGGRAIATAILTRLPVEAKRTQVLGRRLRILEGHLKVAGKSLVVVAGHWSSRISDHTGATRSKYADQIYGRFKGMYLANPKVDFLACGDCNDNPDDESVTGHLHATGDIEAVRTSGEEPKMFNMMAGLWQKGEATLYYGAKPFLFDQVCVSPGMLDEEGWSVEPDSAAIVKEMATKRGRPNRFGSSHDRRPMSARGASDHFPVTVRLRVR